MLRVSVTVSWAGDGYLHLLRAPFDPEGAHDCIAGNDDIAGGDTSGSQLLNLTIQPGEEVVVVTSTFNRLDPIGPYQVTITGEP